MRGLLYSTGSSSSDFDEMTLYIYISFGSLDIFLANGGTLSELELRVLYAWQSSLCDQF